MLKKTSKKEALAYLLQSNDYLFIANDIIFNKYNFYSYRVPEGLILIRDEKCTIISDAIVPATVMDEILNKHKIKTINGNQIPNIKSIDSQLIRKTKLAKFDQIVGCSSNYLKRITSLTDLFYLYQNSNEYQELTIDYEVFIQKRKKEIKSYGIYQEDVLVAAAELTQVYKGSAILIHVVTHPQYRRKGYGEKLLAELINQEVQQGRTLYFFYDNPHAGKLYSKLKANEIDEWYKVNKKSGF